MLPFKLTSVLKDYLWGGTKLRTDFAKQTTLERVAESWELAAHSDGSCIVADGIYAGKSFTELLKEYPEIIGNQSTAETEFPILIKLIDAQKDLSIQVHPADDYARRVEGEAGKTEMWYILDCEPNAFLYFGFSQTISKGEMRRRIEEDTITDVLQKVPVKRGDLFFIRAGTIHAIGAGILLAEIQQNSNTTYRVYDFGRLGADGKPRELHVEKALDVTDTTPAIMEAPGAIEEQIGEGYKLRRLASCEYFSTDRILLDGTYRGKMNGNSFVSVVCTSGNAMLKCGGGLLTLKKGDSAFIPATQQEFELDGKGELLLSMK